MTKRDRDKIIVTTCVRVSQLWKASVNRQESRPLERAIMALLAEEKIFPSLHPELEIMRYQLKRDLLEPPSE